jgi:hypothetical protein
MAKTNPSAIAHSTTTRAERIRYLESIEIANVDLVGPITSSNSSG